MLSSSTTEEEKQHNRSCWNQTKVCVSICRGQMDGGMFKQQSSYPSVLRHLSQSNTGVTSHGRTVVSPCAPHINLCRRASAVDGGPKPDAPVFGQSVTHSFCSIRSAFCGAGREICRLSSLLQTDRWLVSLESHRLTKKPAKKEAWSCRGGWTGASLSNGWM